MNIRRHTNKILLTIFTLALTLASTPTKINAAIPTIKGVYTIFTPDVIGIGQALKTKGWIENVYDFAPNGNAAKELIAALWHKVSEAEQLAPTKKSPVAEITPEVFGKILKYTKDPKTANQETKAEIQETWIAAFLENEYKAKIEEFTKQITNKNNENAKLKNAQNLIPRVEKITTGSIEELEQNKKDFKERDKKIQIISNKIKTNTKFISDTQKKLEKYEQDKKALIEKLKPEIENILDKIEKLAISQDFLPGTAEAILWAFFEDKFTTKDSRAALKNLLLCFKELDPKKLKPIKALEKYAPKEYEKFEAEIKNLDDAAKINKIIEEYDRSTYSSITAANIKTVAPVVKSPSMQFQFSEKIKIPEKSFATCFESAMLDTLSILLYDPKSKTYDTTLLPEDATTSKFFGTIIDSVFEKKVEKDGSSPTFISPKDINTKFQDWINNIENKKEYAIEYHDHEQIDGQAVGYNLNTRIENLIKILNEFFNLGLKIEYNQADPKVLEITNFASIMEKPTDAQDFWNKMFEFISKKISINNSEEKSDTNRTVIFTCKLAETSKPKFEITGDTIKISGSYGMVSVEIKYINYEYQQFNTDFNLHIDYGHAYVKCPTRDQLGLEYSSDFKELLAKKIYAGNNPKLMPLFILLANLNILENTDLKMQNLLFYCMPLKTDQDKLDFMKAITQEGLFENQRFEQPIKSFIEKIFTNEQLTNELLNKIISDEIRNKIADQIIQSSIEKNPIISLPTIISKVKIDANLEKFIEEKIKSLDIVSFNTKWDCTILSLAQQKGLKKIVATILENQYTENFDKIIYYINEIEQLKTEVEKKEAYDKAIELINYPKTELNGPGEKFTTPLHIAIKTNNLELFKALLTNKKIDINKQEGYEYRTPIVYAFHKNYNNPNEKTIQFVQALLNHKNENGQYDINLEIKDKDNKTAIYYAQGELKNLIESTTEKRKNEKIKLEAKSANKETAIPALNKIINTPSTKTDEELQAAAIEIISNHELEISTIVGDQTALTNSAYKKLDTISNAILSHPKVKAFDKLNYYIITKNNIEAIKLIDDPKTEIDGPKDLFSKSLGYAINKNNKEIVEKLLLRTDVDVQSCLFIAALKSIEILELLLKDNRTKINARILGDRTALDVAGMYSGTTKNKELLKKYGAKNGADINGARIPIDGEEEGQ